MESLLDEIQVQEVEFDSKLFGTVETLVRPRAGCGAVIACGGCAYFFRNTMILKDVSFSKSCV